MQIKVTQAQIDQKNTVDITTNQFENIGNPFMPAKSMINLATLKVHNLGAIVKTKNFSGYTGKFTVNTFTNGEIDFKRFKGIGSITLNATRNILYTIKINKTGLAINRNYFYGCLGIFEIAKFESLAQKVINSENAFLHDVIQKNLGQAARFIVKGDLSRNVLSSNFISIYGTGVIILELPFSSEYLIKDNINKGNDTICKNVANLVLFQNTLDVSVLDNVICAIKGDGIVYSETVSNLCKEDNFLKYFNFVENVD